MTAVSKQGGNGDPQWDEIVCDDAVKVMIVTSTYLFVWSTNTHSFGSHTLSISAWVDLGKYEQYSINLFLQWLMALHIPIGPFYIFFKLRTVFLTFQVMTCLNYDIRVSEYICVINNWATELTGIRVKCATHISYFNAVNVMWFCAISCAHWARLQFPRSYNPRIYKQQGYHVKRHSISLITVETTKYKIVRPLLKAHHTWEI